MRSLFLPAPPLYRLSPHRVLWLLLLLSTTRIMPPNNGNNNNGNGGMLGANAELLPDNQVEASFRLALPAGDLRRGNAVQVSRDDRFLWVTTAEGALHKIQLGSGSDDADGNENILTYTPTGTVRCESGVVETTASNKLIIYNVQFDDGTDTSAVMAIDATTLELQWNVTVVGQLQGTPVLSDNDYLYVTHQSTAVPFGQLTVIPLAAERAVATLALEGTTQVTAPTVVFDDATGGDIVYVAAAEGEGLLYAVTWTDAHVDNQGAGAESYRVVQASNLADRAVAPPAATLDGAVYLGQESSTLLGWENVLQDPVPAWGYSFAAPAGGGRDSALEREYNLSMVIINFIVSSGSLTHFIRSTLFPFTRTLYTQPFPSLPYSPTTTSTSFSPPRATRLPLCGWTRDSSPGWTTQWMLLSGRRRATFWNPAPIRGKRLSTLRLAATFASTRRRTAILIGIWHFVRTPTTMEIAPKCTPPFPSTALAICSTMATGTATWWVSAWRTLRRRLPRPSRRPCRPRHPARWLPPSHRPRSRRHWRLPWKLR